jgi:hypothetical protein
MRANRKSIPLKSTTITLRGIFKKRMAKGVLMRREG